MKLMWTDTAHRDWDGYLKAPKVISNGPSKPRKGKSPLYLTDSYKLHCIIKCIKPHREDISAFPTQVEEHHSKLKGCRSKWGVVVWIPSKGSGGKAWVNPGYVCLLSEQTSQRPQRGGHTGMHLFRRGNVQWTHLASHHSTSDCPLKTIIV